MGIYFYLFNLFNLFNLLRMLCFSLCLCGECFNVCFCQITELSNNHITDNGQSYNSHKSFAVRRGG